MINDLTKSKAIYRHTHLFIFTLVLIIGSAVVLSYNYKKTNEMNQQIVEKDAVHFADLVSSFRNFYSKNIVPAARDHGMNITHDYKGKSSALPLPATFAKDFGESISNANSTYRVKLYSDLPFPWRGKTELNENDKKTLEQIKLNPQKPVISYETIEGVKVLRYARADVMNESCVGCHNNYIGTPKTDWKVGDVRGVLEIIRPINSAGVSTIGMLKESFLMMLAIILTMVGLIFFVLRKLTNSLDSAQDAYTQQEKTSKKLEASGIKMKAIVNSVEEVIIVINEEGTITECNNSIEKVFGYTQEEMTGKNVSILMQGEQSENHDKYIKAFIENKEGNVMAQNREFVAIRKNGEEFPIELFVNDARVGDEVIFTGSIRDITHRKITQEITENAHKAAVESAELKSEFLANMSHEIRTPMNGVIGMTEMLLLSDLDEDQKELAHTVKDSADSLLTIINDILDFSKLEAGKLTIKKNKFSLIKMIEGSIDLLAKEATNKQVELAFFIDKDVPLDIVGDSGRLRQVLINLFNNALKFTENGHVILHVSQLDDSNLSFSIIDSGIGIPQDDLKTLFDSFSQVDGSSSREHGGTGLGLAICKQIVTLMEGELGVKSEVGNGSTFWFTIKIDPITDTTPKPYIQINTNVLMWSTSDTLNRFYKEQLSQWGMKTTIVKTLNNLSSQLDINKYDMIALDADNLFINLENPDSYSPILEALREKTNAVFVLYASNLQYQALSKFKLDKHTVLFKKPIKHTAIKELVASLSERKPLKEVSKPEKKNNEPVVLEKNKNNEVKDITEITIGSVRDKFHLLIAEDNIINQKVAEKMLNNLGCKISLVINGREAVEEATNNYYDAIFMDCQMPELDGYEATKLIRELPEDHQSHGIPIIAFTANAMKDDYKLCQEAGMDDYLCKPVSLEKLEQTLNKWLDTMTKRQDKQLEQTTIKEQA